MPKGKRSEKWIQHYSSSQKILLVGEGDFSFSACLARSFSSGHNMVATSFDSEDMLRIKHWSSTDHVQKLKKLGCKVLHDVDVSDMHEHAILSMMKFDRIVYNFPHAGHDSLCNERDPDLIRKHRELLMAFFRSSCKMLTEDGEIHVAHRNDYPYIRWKIEKSAKKVGLVLFEMVEFIKTDYPGYHNKRGGGIKSNKTFPLKDCFTFKFASPERLQKLKSDSEDVLSLYFSSLKV